MKHCGKCGISKSLSDFPRHRGKPMGLYANCKPCKSLEAKGHRSRHGDAVRMASRAWHHRNLERSRGNSRAWREANTEAKAAYWRKWYGVNGRSRPPDQRCRDIRQARPSWANRFFIAEAYRLARLRSQIMGFDWEVDHVIPLKGRSVCGLHVETNLAVVPASVNRRKGNRMEAQ